MATTQFKINGVVDTSQNVLTNINTLATAAGAFVTWDPATGTWSVIKNTTGTPVMTFDDTNIIGNINVSGSGINDLYNAVTIEFPHQDLKDTRDYIDLEIPEGERFPQELDNKLDISLECINDPVQAQFIAARELKQSRVDKIIEFSTSYLGNGLSAGDLIGVTSSMYGYTNKVFRVITIQEEDSEDAGIVFSIQALEYDPDVYSTDGLVRTERNKKTGITPKAANEVILQQDAAGAGNILENLTPLALLSLLNKFVTGYSDDAGNQYGAVVNAYTDNARVNGIPQSADNSDYQFAGVATFVAPFTATYSLQIIADQNSSGAVGGRGFRFDEPEDTIRILAQVFDSNNNLLASESSGGEGAFFWTDFAMSLKADLQAGEIYELEFAVVNYTESIPSGQADVTFAWSIVAVAG